MSREKSNCPPKEVTQMINFKENKIKIKVIKPRIGKTCVCPICHKRFPFKKNLKILELSG
jgi:hypothetical protein